MRAKTLPRGSVPSESVLQMRKAISSQAQFGPAVTSILDF